MLNAFFTTGNPFFLQNLLEVSIGRDLGALEGLLTQKKSSETQAFFLFATVVVRVYVGYSWCMCGIIHRSGTYHV